MKTQIENKEKKFIIIDSTSNSGADYIGSDGFNCHLESNAIEFDSEKQAKEFAESLN